MCDCRRRASLSRATRAAAARLNAERARVRLVSLPSACPGRTGIEQSARAPKAAPGDTTSLFRPPPSPSFTTQPPPPSPPKQISRPPAASSWRASPPRSRRSGSPTCTLVSRRNGARSFGSKRRRRRPPLTPPGPSSNPVPPPLPVTDEDNKTTTTPLPARISREAVCALEAELDQGAGVQALRRFNAALKAVPSSKWRAALDPLFSELCFNLESFNPAFAACVLQVQRTIGVSDYVRRDVALKNLIQPLAGEYGMHNGLPQRELWWSWVFWVGCSKHVAALFFFPEARAHTPAKEPTTHTTHNPQKTHHNKQNPPQKQSRPTASSSPTFTSRSSARPSPTSSPPPPPPPTPPASTTA